MDTTIFYCFSFISINENVLACHLQTLWGLQYKKKKTRDSR